MFQGLTRLLKFYVLTSLCLAQLVHYLFLISILKSSLNNSCMFQPLKKKIKVIPRSDTAVCEVWSGSTVWKSFHQVWDQQTAKCVAQKKVSSSTALFNHSQLIFDWLCLGLTTRQPLWVILCRLPEKGRKEIEEIVEETKERDREERGTGMKVKKQKK